MATLPCFLAVEDEVQKGKRVVGVTRGGHDMKSILYSASSGAAVEDERTGGRRRHANATAVGQKPFATGFLTEGSLDDALRGPRGRPRPRLGDLGNKFTVGAPKVGSGVTDLNVYRENYAASQNTARDGRLRNSVGGGNILAHVAELEE